MYSKIVARELKEAVVEIYGDIGEKVNGDYLATEINYLGKNSDVITFKINSLGGNVMQGLSIVGAIVSSPAKTVAVIEGIAGSMAGVIALACKEVEMNDFARLMLHAPRYLDNNGNVITSLTADEVESIKNFTGQITDILSRRGKSKADIEAILAKESWYNADEALASGFINKIIDTGVAAVAAKLSIEKLVAFANEKAQEGNDDLSTKTDNMKKIAAKLGLPEASDELAIIAAIDQKETALAAERKALVDSVIAVGKKNGIVNDTNLASMSKLGATDLNLLVDLVVKPVTAEDNTRLSAVLAKVTEMLENGEMKEKKDEKDWDWYQKNDSAGLLAMKAKEPEKYNKLYKAYWG